MPITPVEATKISSRGQPIGGGHQNLFEGTANSISSYASCGLGTLQANVPGASVGDTAVDYNCPDSITGEM
jgi:hypothetical protein